MKKKNSVSLIIRKMQIKTTMRCHLILAKIAIIKKTRGNKYRQVHDENPVRQWWKCRMVQLLWKAVQRFLQKLKLEIPYDLAILLLGIQPQELKSGSQRDVHGPMFTISQSVSSVAQSCPTLCDPTDYSTPGLPVRHQLLELAQTHVHQVSDATSHHLILCCPLLLPPSIIPSIRVVHCSTVHNTAALFHILETT